MSTSTLSPVRAAPSQGRSDVGRPALRSTPRLRAAQARSVRACSLDTISGTDAPARRLDTAAVEGGSTGLRLTRRGQAVVVGALLVVAAVMLAVEGPSLATAGEPPPAVYQTVTVQPGQSLWQIARAAAPDVDPRSTVAWIVDLNGLPSGGLVQAGQQIVVPATPK